MNSYVKANYDRFRKLGHSVDYSLRAARIVDEFEDMQNDKHVRLVAEPEEESYFSVYGEPDSKKEREAIVRQIELNGCWDVRSQYYNESKERWETADSVGMVTGYNDPTSPYGTDYVVNLMASAIEQHRLMNAVSLGITHPIRS